MDKKKKPTPREEVFIAELIKGKSQRKAYLEAYPRSEKWKPETVDKRAYELNKRGYISGRFEELKQKVVDEIEKESIVTVKEIVKEFKKIAFSKITDFLAYKIEKVEVGKDENGDIIYIPKPVLSMKPSEEIDSSAIKKVSVDSRGRFTIELHDKVKSLERLGDYMNMFNNNSFGDNQKVSVIDDLPEDAEQ